MKFEDVAASIEARKPRATILVPESAWADTWENRPREQVLIGLRTMSDAEKTDATGDARRHAEKIGDVPSDAIAATLWLDAYNDFMMRRTIARSTCDPNDIHAGAYEFGGAPEELVADRLSTSGVKFLFDAIERFELSQDLSRNEATDEEIAALAGRVADLVRIHPARQSRVRRLLHFCITELEAH